MGNPATSGTLGAGVGVGPLLEAHGGRSQTDEFLKIDLGGPLVLAAVSTYTYSVCGVGVCPPPRGGLCMPRRSPFGISLDPETREILERRGRR